jgi:Erg28 like protein
MEGRLRCGRRCPACCAYSVQRTRRTDPSTVSSHFWHYLSFIWQLLAKLFAQHAFPLLDVLSECCSCAGVTLASFVLALIFFTSELLLFKTLSWKMALQPMIVAGAISVLQAAGVTKCCRLRPQAKAGLRYATASMHAGVSVLWMGLGHNYYLDYSAQPSEELDGILQRKRA